MPIRIKKVCLFILIAAVSVTALAMAGAFVAVPLVGAHGALVIENVDAGLLSSNLTEIIDRFAFSEPWKPADDAAAVESVGTLDVLPYNPLGDDRCLRVTAPEGAGSVSVVREYAYPMNFSAARWLSFGVCLPDDPGRSFIASVKVTWLDGTQYTASAPVSGRTWNAVLCKIADGMAGAGGGLVSVIELTLTAADTLGFTAYFDTLGLSSYDGFYTAMKCLSDKWYAGGGLLELPGDGTMTLYAEDTDPFIETVALRYNNFAGTDALRVRLANGAGCKSVTLYYTTYESPDFSTERSRTVEIQAASAPQTLYLPVTSDYVGQIRLVFNGELRGDIKIHSITPVSTYVSRDIGYADIMSCKVTSSETIRIEGTLTEPALKKLRGTNIQLYELECWQTADAATLAALTPIDSVGALHSFAFEFPLYRSDGTSRINSKFALTAIRDGVPVLLDGYKYITNPEYLAQIETQPSRPTLIRGASPAAGEPYGGTAQTVIEVSMPELMTLTGSGVTFTSDGVVYAADSEFVQRLDELVRRNTENGVRVYLRLTTRYTGSTAENRVFNYPGSAGTAVYAAFNTATVSGIGYLRAACEFLASRYSAGDYQSGRVYGYIIGCSVETAYKYYNLGAAPLSDFVTAYGNALRIAYNAVRSTAGAGPEVYAAFGSTWDTDLSAGSRYVYDSRSVIDALDNMYGEEGDIGWQPAFDPYPEEQGYLAYADRSAGADYSADRITFANLDLLCSYFMRQQLYYNGVYRGILLCERPASVARAYLDPVTATADYIYAVYKLTGINYSIVNGFIISHANIIDPQVFAKIDTQDSIAVSEPYKAVLGIDEWRELIPAFDEGAAVRRYVTETQISSAPPAGLGKYRLWSFSDGTAGWVGTLDCESISGGNTFDGRENLLRIKLSPRTHRGGVYADFEYRYDLSIAPALGFSMQLAALPDGVDGAEMTLILTDGTSIARATGHIEPGRWNDIYADFSSFAGIRGCTRLALMLRGTVKADDGTVSYTDIGEPVVMLGEIKAYSGQYGDTELEKLFDDARDAALSQNTRKINTGLVWIASCIIMLTASLWTVYILARLRRRTGE